MSEILRSIPLFSELDSSQLQKLQDISTVQKYKDGEVFFKKGDECRGQVNVIVSNSMLYCFIQKEHIMPRKPRIEIAGY